MRYGLQCPHTLRRLFGGFARKPLRAKEALRVANP